MSTQKEDVLFVPATTSKQTETAKQQQGKRSGFGNAAVYLYRKPIAIGVAATAQVPERNQTIGRQIGHHAARTDKDIIAVERPSTGRKIAGEPVIVIAGIIRLKKLGTGIVSIHG